jgi:hypothetical protein
MYIILKIYLFVGYYMRTSHSMLSEDLASNTHWHAPYFFFTTCALTSFFKTCSVVVIQYFVNLLESSIGLQGSQACS